MHHNSTPDTAITFEIGLNPLWPGQKLGARANGENRWSAHQRAWRTERHNIDSLAQAVCGHGFAFGAVLSNSWRVGKYFTSAQVFGTDHDGASLNTLLADPFIQKFAAFIYETPSSTAANLKSHAVFVLDSPVTDPQMAMLAYRRLIFRFSNGVPDIEADHACKDPVRFFYGKPQADHMILGNVLYRDILQEEVLEPYLAAIGVGAVSASTATMVYQGNYKPHAGDPLSPADQEDLALLLRGAGLTLGRDGRYNGACILKHTSGPWSCAGAFYASAKTGFGHCFCSDHEGENSGGVRALATIGFSPTDTTRFSHQEIKELLGQDWYGPGFAKARAEESSPRVRSMGRTPILSNRTRDNGPRPALWAGAKQFFPFPSGGKPWVYGAALVSTSEDKVALVNFLSNSWRNPVNAQHKRRTLYFNIFPRITGSQVYERHLPIDDWSKKSHEALAKRINRAIKKADDAEHFGWMWLNNALARGYYVYLTNVPGLEGFTPVNDIELSLVDALQAITPPPPSDDSSRFRPYGGSENWVSAAADLEEEDKENWDILVTRTSATDFVQIEAECVVGRITYAYVREYWRSQHGSDLVLEIPIDSAMSLAEGLGCTLVNSESKACAAGWMS